MEERSKTFQLAEELQFRPKWWWDPVPPWILERIELTDLARLAVTQLEIEKARLEGQIKVTEQAIGIVRKLVK